MPIIVTEPVGQKGKKDAKRHRDKQREAIKERLPDIISEENIITRRKGKIVRVPIKNLEIPIFKPRKSDKGKSGGIGQGDGSAKKGDVIGQSKGSGQGSSQGQPGDEPGAGQPGQEPGEDYIETEIEMEELIELMFEDLGLPRLKDKELKEIEVQLGFKFKGLTDSGAYVHLDRRATATEGMKRFWGYLKYLESETGKDELTCFNALKQAQGLLNDALELLDKNTVTMDYDMVEPFVILENKDLRFKDMKPDIQKESMAVIIAMMDVSASMTTLKKYFARSILFWLVEFLRKVYDKVEIRFIIHHSTAKNVDEDMFFHTKESGGTQCYTAYELAGSLIDVEYPTNRWNVYPLHFSDGDDANTDRTIEELVKLLDREISMFGYGQIEPADESFNMFGWSNKNSALWNKFKNYFHLQEDKDSEVQLMAGGEDLPFVQVIIEGREDLLPALRAILKADRWTE